MVYSSNTIQLLFIHLPLQKMKILSVIGVVFVTIFLSQFLFSTKVPAGYEAILVNQYSQAGVQDNPLVTGRVWYNPFTQDLVKYPVYVQTKDYEPFEITAKDGSKFTVDPTISYRIEVGATPLIYQKYRKDIDQITDVVMLQMVKESFRLVLNKYTTDEMISKVGEIDAELTKTLVESAKSEKIVIERLTSGLKYPQSITDAIANKNKVVQDAQRVENELRIAEAQARIKKQNAKSEAAAKIAEAEGNAKAKLIESEANAKSIEIQSKAIQAQGGEDYVKLQWIEKVWAKWNGAMPTTTLGNDMNMYLNMGTK